MTVPVIMEEHEVADMFERGRVLLDAGRVTEAHRLFAEIGVEYPDHPGIEHALAASIPNSLVVQPEGQIDRRTAPILAENTGLLLDYYSQVRLLLLDLETNTFLPSHAVEILANLQQRQGLTLKLLNVQPKPKEILHTLRMAHLFWDDFSCPVCGPKRMCVQKFAWRERHIIRFNGAV